MNSTDASHYQSEPRTIGIVGAGLMGRLLAFMLSRRGAQVTLFDRDSEAGTKSCGYTGAGMLAPISELEASEPIIARLGFESLPLWEGIIRQLELPVFFRRLGTLIVAHHLDLPDLSRFSHMLKSRLIEIPESILPDYARSDIHWELNRTEIIGLEPQLGERFRNGIFLPQEGQIDNRQLLVALGRALKRQGVNWQTNTEIEGVLPHHIDDGLKAWQFDWVIDCRGLGMRPDWNIVRGVRGEIFRVHAPEVDMSRPIRLMHPRYPLYIVPRERNHYLIGATSIESEDFRPATVQSALELLSAAFTVHSGFAEASVLEMQVNCRPALPDNLPRIQISDGLIRVNGLYRHGFLISPRLAELICDYLGEGRLNLAYNVLYETERLEEEAVYATAH